MYSVFQSNKLPSKLSTILTARESDLKHPGVKSQGSLLSPGEWSKLLLTRILAQVIHDNDNVLSTTGSNGERNLDNSLVGSVLLLDDLTAWLSEVEEATLLKNLRRTGSATVFSSNKWSTGRFADRIYVVKDGAIVEAGTHDELLMRGPQQSLYAAKWHAMSMV
jgi:ABC-type transport system involved in cytochrome bd biosynthesis fused ATPase/permease subunit